MIQGVQASMVDSSNISLAELTFSSNMNESLTVAFTRGNAEGMLAWTRILEKNRSVRVNASFRPPGRPNYCLDRCVYVLLHPLFLGTCNHNSKISE